MCKYRKEVGRETHYRVSLSGGALGAKIEQKVNTQDRQTDRHVVIRGGREGESIGPGS